MVVHQSYLLSEGSWWRQSIQSSALKETSLMNTKPSVDGIAAAAFFAMAWREVSAHKGVVDLSTQ